MRLLRVNLSTILLVTLFIALICLSFVSEILGSLVMVLVLLYFIYDIIIRNNYLKNKNSKLVTKELYEFKPRIESYFFLILFLSYFNIYSSYQNNKWTSDFELIPINSIKDYITLLSPTELLSIISLLLITVIWFYAFIKSFINKTKLYEEGILTYNGDLIKYEDIENIFMIKYIKNIKYEIKVKNCLGALSMTCFKEDEGFVNDVLYTKTKLPIEVVDKSGYSS